MAATELKQAMLVAIKTLTHYIHRFSDLMLMWEVEANMIQDSLKMLHVLDSKKNWSYLTEKIYMLGITTNLWYNQLDHVKTYYIGTEAESSVSPSPIKCLQKCLAVHGYCEKTIKTINLLTQELTERIPTAADAYLTYKQEGIGAVADIFSMIREMMLVLQNPVPSAVDGLLVICETFSTFTLMVKPAYKSRPLNERKTTEVMVKLLKQDLNPSKKATEKHKIDNRATADVGTNTDITCIPAIKKIKIEK